MTLFLFWVLCGIAAAMVASSKGRSAAGWFFLGLILGPFGLIFALISGKEGPADGERKCPFCAEFIKKEAVVCKHCGRDLPAPVVAEKLKQDSEWDRETMLFAGREIASLSCPKCGTKHQEGAELCRACGWKPA